MAAAQRQKVVMARRRFWARHLQGWKRSGLSQAEYCRQQQLSAPTLSWWKRQLATAQTRGHPAATRRQIRGKDRSFVELTRADGGAPLSGGEIAYEIVLPGHRRLRLGRHFEPERVRQLLRVLEGEC